MGLFIIAGIGVVDSLMSSAPFQTSNSNRCFVHSQAGGCSGRIDRIVTHGARRKIHTSSN